MFDKKITSVASKAANEIKKVMFGESVIPKHKCITFYEGTVTQEDVTAASSALEKEGFRFWLGAESDFTGFVSRKCRLWVAGTGNSDGSPSLTWGWY